MTFVLWRRCKIGTSPTVVVFEALVRQMALEVLSATWVL